MTAPRSSLRSFLVSAKSNLHNAIISQQRVTLVIGNESADLDSIVSAIVLAYLRSSSVTSPLTNASVNKHTPPSQYPPLYIPLANIPRADIKIRPELLALLPYANLEQSHLITLDDLKSDPPAGLDPTGKEHLQPQLARLLLVDHNKLAGPLTNKGFSDQVVGCIDHHIDEHTVPSNTGNEPRIIEKCGSCTSLVVQSCRSAWDSLSSLASSASKATAGQSDANVGVDDDAVRRTWDAQIAKFALASILTDTHNLQDLDKTMDADKQVVDYLEAKILLAPGSAGANWDREAFSKEIGNAKRDLSQLTLQEILKKDYKQWEVNDKQLGVSSVVQPLSWQIEKAGGAESFRQQLDDFAKQRNLDICSIMTTSTSTQGAFQRELLLWSLNASNTRVVDNFTSHNQKELGLKLWQEQEDLSVNDSSSGKMEVWWQTETKFSRKQVAPMLRKAAEGI